jgi:antitoxin component YwqK of YwqJK toxin-antitoxin module
MKYSFLLALYFIFPALNAQTGSTSGDTLFNQTDKQGLKQGYWKVKYPSGAIKYTVFYKDSKPEGIMKRYFDDNSLMAELQFSPKTTRIKAKLYFQDGPLAADGIYSQKDVKDSTWNYYSYYTKTLRSRENYANGNKNGMSYSYFEDGKIAEEREWKNGVSHGIWRQYYQNGAVKLVCNYVDGKRNGDFTVNYPDNKPEWQGAYVDDKREGKWTHYDPDGSVQSVTEYKNGVATNADELQAKEQKKLDDIEKQKGKIPEPDETNIMPGSR